MANTHTLTQTFQLRINYWCFSDAMLGTTRWHSKCYNNTLKPVETKLGRVHERHSSSPSSVLCVHLHSTTAVQLS